MPTRPGVYVFKDQSGLILYVGKAKNLKNRVKSYFQPSINLSPKTAQLVSLINNIEHIEVGFEIEALLLESRLIKKFRPHYNIASKDGKSPFYIHITQEKFPNPIINHESKKSVAGPFLNGFLARQILKSFRRIAPYHSETPCFYRHLGLCHPCPNEKDFDVKLYKTNIQKLKSLLKGNFSAVSRKLKIQMQQASKSQDFENAALIRNQIKNLEYLLAKPVSADEYIVNPNLVEDKRRDAVINLQKIPPLKVRGGGKGELYLHRIEMYDISNLSGTAATGAMTVAIDGALAPREYRHFTIKSINTPNDVEMMREMLTRRLNHKDWPKPDLIILDGGKSQLSIVNWDIPTFGLAKQDEIIFDVNNNQIKLDRSNTGLQLLQQLRDEAHRFSRRLHHKHRRIIIK